VVGLDVQSVKTVSRNVKMDQVPTGKPGGIVDVESAAVDVGDGDEAVPEPEAPLLLRSLDVLDAVDDF
jgi:hypothetical protein